MCDSPFLYQMIAEERQSMIKQIEIKGKIIGQGIPKVCVPLVGRTEEEIMQQADHVCQCTDNGEIDMVEFRGDYFEGLDDIPRLLALLQRLQERLTDKILLFTIRSEAEGGEKLAFTTPGICEINYAVIESAIPDMVDVELFSGAENIQKLVACAHQNGVYVIMSNHDFHTTPEADVMLNRLRSMQDMGADVAKIAVMPNDEMQLLRLLAVTNVMYEKYTTIPLITISMGRLGTLSRLCGQIFGSAVTFAALDQASAPGQIQVNELNMMLKWLNRHYSI